MRTAQTMSMAHIALTYYAYTAYFAKAAERDATNILPGLTPDKDKVMPEASQELTTAKTAFDDPVSKLRHMANAAPFDEVLSDGPISPDWLLMDLAAEVGKLLDTRAEGIRHREALLDIMPHGSITSGQTILDLCGIERVLTRKAAAVLRHAAKIPARTPAGIYAKAFLVRKGVAGAGALGMSLADDLLRSPAIRRAIWPADALNDRGNEITGHCLAGVPGGGG